MTQQPGRPRPRRADVADSYDRGAAAYETLWSPVILPPAIALVTSLPLTSRCVIADVGAGTGALLDVIGAASPTARVAGLDASPEMLRVARARRGAPAIVADALALPLADEIADAVILAYVLFHLADPARAVAEAARVLRGGGRLGSITWAWERASRADTIWDQALTSAGVPPGPLRRVDAGLDTPGAVECLLQSAGLRPQRIWPHRLAHQWDSSSYWELATGWGANRAPPQPHRRHRPRQLASPPAKPPRPAGPARFPMGRRGHLRRRRQEQQPARDSVPGRAPGACTASEVMPMPGDHPGSPADAAEGTYATAGTRGYVIQPMRRSLPGVHRRRNDTGNFRGERMTVDDLLAEARRVLPLRPGPAEALAAQAKGALLIDIRGDDQRRACGLIPGALVLPRNSLEWRCDPASPSRHPAINDRSRSVILICNEGFQSSLAAATLHRLGLVNATDLDGGFIAWATAGLPVVPAE